MMLYAQLLRELTLGVCVVWCMDRANMNHGRAGWLALTLCIYVSHIQPCVNPNRPAGQCIRHLPKWNSFSVNSAWTASSTATRICHGSCDEVSDSMQGAPAGDSWAQDFASQMQLGPNQRPQSFRHAGPPHHHSQPPLQSGPWRDKQQHMMQSHQQQRRESAQQANPEAPAKSLSKAWNELFVRSAAASTSRPYPPGVAEEMGQGADESSAKTGPAGNAWAQEFQAENASRRPEADRWAEDFQAHQQARLACPSILILTFSPIMPLPCQHDQVSASQAEQFLKL